MSGFELTPEQVSLRELAAEVAREVYAPKAAESKAAEKASDAVRAATDATASTLDAKKDPARLSGVAKSEPPKRTGQIAVLISRKDSKLYVRQNFSPLFEVPVTIAPSDRPLGTHVFTADVDKKDTNVLHWSVVTLPVSTVRLLVSGHAAGNPVEKIDGQREKSL